MKILKFRGVNNVKQRKFHVKITYKTNVELTPRTIATAEAFGLGIDGEKTFEIVDSDFDVNYGDVVYITGDSGSGKSSILKAFKEEFKDDVVDINDVEIDADKPLVDAIGESVEEALQILSAVGLNDAFLFLRKYPELSDGQKLRFKIAKLMQMKRKVWVCDEFTAPLDRDTAKIVAWNLQKFARRIGVTILVATCNDDLEADLAPNMRVDKKYNNEIVITYFAGNAAPTCSLMRDVTVSVGSAADWRRLSQFHYRSHNVMVPLKYIRMTRNVCLCVKQDLPDKCVGDCLKCGFNKPELIGVVVFCAAGFVSFGRRFFYGECLNRSKQEIQELNRLFSSISRVVIHPKYRSIGLGAYLVAEALKLSPTRFTETVAVMARYNPFFEKGGMVKVCDYKVQPYIADALNVTLKYGFNTTFLTSPSYVQSKLEAFKPDELQKFKEEFIQVCRGPVLYDYIKNRGFNPKNPDFRVKLAEADNELFVRIIARLSVMASPKIYLAYDKNWVDNHQLKQEHIQLIKQRIQAAETLIANKNKRNIYKQNVKHTKTKVTRCVNPRPYGESANCADYDALSGLCKATEVKCVSRKIEEVVEEEKKVKPSRKPAADKCPKCGKPIRKVHDKETDTTYYICAKCKKSWKEGQFVVTQK